MGERFFIKEIHICPFDRTDIGKLKPNLVDYPTRFCVIDEEKKIAIDIKTRLKYDYIETVSQVHFLSQSYKKIVGDRRVAVFPYKNLNYNDDYLIDAVDIVNQIKNNKEFQDGNDVYGNEQYLEYLKQEKEIEQEELIDYQLERQTTKKIGKRKK